METDAAADPPEAEADATPAPQTGPAADGGAEPAAGLPDTLDTAPVAQTLLEALDEAADDATTRPVDTPA
jgi:hypothetical protein